MLQLRRRNLHATKRTPTFGQIVVARQGIQREGVSIQMVFKIKDAWEPGASEFRFVPGAVRILSLEEPCDSSLNRRIVRTDGCKQTNQAPGRLRRSTLPFSLQGGIIIGKDRLAESTVTILN